MRGARGLHHDRTAHGAGRLLQRGLRTVGEAAIAPTLGCWRLLGLGAAVVVQGLQPGYWRRSVRDEFMRHCHEAGIAALPAVIVVGMLVGLGLVLQALYWLGLFGQTGVVGQLLVLVLVRELAPLIVGILMIGRSVTVHVAELHAIAESGKLATLDAMGIDPFNLLVLPRVVAMSLCCFCLNVVFLATALVVGYLGASGAGLSNLSFHAFLGDVLANMGVADFALSAVKPLLFGFLSTLIACKLALWPGRETLPLRVQLPRVFVSSMAAVLVVSVLVSALL